MRFVYVALSYLLAPLVFLVLFWRGLRNPEYLKNFKERFGFIQAFEGSTIWVHAVSVGEVHAVAPLVEALIKKYPNYPVLVTTVTPTGRDRVLAIFAGRVRHAYAPYDLPGSVRRFYKRANPKLAVIIETELWPNLYHECGVRRVPLVLASARISPKSVLRYRRFVSLFKEALSHGIVIAAQSDADAERFESLGANPNRTHTVGNIKFDFALPERVVEDAKAFRAAYCKDRLVWIAGSTHDDEEEQLIGVWKALKQKHKNMLWILVPRHPERFESVHQLLKSHGLNVVVRTSKEVVTDTTDVLLIDTLGELTTFFAVSDVAFVAGSLVPIGGHNLLEPAVLGIPTITGPHNFNAQDIADKLFAANAAVRVEHADALISALDDLFMHPQKRKAMTQAAYTVIKENRGALARLLELIDPLLKKKS